MRIANYKLVFPRLTQKHNKSSNTIAASSASTVASSVAVDSVEEYRRHKRESRKINPRVSSSVAPVTMFQKNKGLSNPDITSMVIYIILQYRITH